MRESRQARAHLAGDAREGETRRARLGSDPEEGGEAGGISDPAAAPHTAEIAFRPV